MVLTFLGTSAGDAYPIAFCSCDNCAQARILGGPSLRMRSSVLIDDDLLIDLGPDIMTASLLHKRPLCNVRYCLQTHGHSDHFDLTHLLAHSPEWGVRNTPLLQLYGSRLTLERADQTFERDIYGHRLSDKDTCDRLNIELQRIAAGQLFSVGPYQVVAVAANHQAIFEPLLFAITRGNQSIFYGTDTGPLSEETCKTLHRYHLRFDVAVLDHTCGLSEPGTDHLNAQQVIEHFARMRSEGLLKAAGRTLATHLAHDCNPVHPIMVEYASQHGYEVAFDGLAVECGHNHGHP